MAGRALWRRAYDAVERPVGARLEAAVQTDAFAEVAALLVRTRAGVARRLERTTRHALHRVNLPAASDVARLREQVAALDRSVRRLDEAVRTGTPGGGADGPSSRPGRARGAGAPRRRPQPAAGAQRGEVRDRDRPAEGRDDAQGRGLAP